MTFYELLCIISDYESDQSNVGARLGCECGCGGDAYDYESWDDMCQRGEEAKTKLKNLGITFD